VLRIETLAGAARYACSAPPCPLAAALAAYERDPGNWPESGGPVLVVDMDGHALTWSVVERESGFCICACARPRRTWAGAVAAASSSTGLRIAASARAAAIPRESAQTEQASTSSSSTRWTRPPPAEWCSCACRAAVVSPHDAGP